MLTILLSGSVPVELHPLLCRLIECTGMMDPKLHTCGCSAHPTVPLYEVQTAALIIVTMKLLFGLNDQTEWWTHSLLTCHIVSRYLYLTQMLCVCAFVFFRDLSSQRIEHQHAGELLLDAVMLVSCCTHKRTLQVEELPDSSDFLLDCNVTGDQFSFRRWYRLLQGVLIRAQNRQKVDVLR